MRAEVYEAFRAIDVPEDKALRAAEALSKRYDDVHTLRGDLHVLQWMVGFMLAFQVAVVFKLFLR